MEPLRIGFSPCPNDTFMFDALVHGRVPFSRPVEPVLEDVEALNARAAGPVEHRLPVTKLSAAAVLDLAGDVRILDAGAALGRGCGPLVVTRAGGPSTLTDLAGRRVAVPGMRTTATLLFEIFGPPAQLVPMRFDRVVKAVAEGTVEAGLLIHELRFTYEAMGLACVADLGDLWERETGHPLPLGVIAVRRKVPEALATELSSGLAASIRRAFADPEAAAPFVAAHAQSMDPDVCRRHIELYVNAYSERLGPEGRAALCELAMRAHAAGRPLAAFEFVPTGG
ncbi:MAG: 1,4-dihydroxy-6-naphthoate synthase [Deltaproteobacteria bacterium]|nr:MAG: 1,4-dihydroxy-6-naphthoate synthase [Deltaproteobacteria bacterium]